MIERGDYQGKSIIILKKDKNDKFFFSFGLSKAKLILDNIEEIKKFVSEHSDSKVNQKESVKLAVNRNSNDNPDMGKTTSLDSRYMKVQELINNLSKAGEDYKKNKVKVFPKLFENIILATLEWAKAENVSEIDGNDPAVLSIFQRIINEYSRMRKKDQAVKILQLALNHASFEDYRKACPETPKLNLPRLPYHKPNPDRVSDKGEWDGSWDDAVKRYEGD
mgnify:CR=1 FL=1